VEPLVSSEWLALRLGEASLRVVDVRWYVDPARNGRDAYRAGHLPGAVFLDVDLDLSGPGGARGGPLGRHPWPSEQQVGRVMGAAGIGPETRVVAYDDQAGAIAARLWYLLRAHGHDAAAVLDGGIVKWQAEGRPMTVDVPAVAPCRFEARLRPGFVVAKGELRERAAEWLVLDARAGERYRGELEPLDPRAGHIPGAVNAPYADNLTSGPLPVFAPAEALRARYLALGAGARAPVVYCGSGVTACHDLLALHLSGLAGRLYAGSWSEWSADPSSPVASGAE
jgi:thiosulfate/3-mercaptopyruvate sulfurtransferase